LSEQPNLQVAVIGAGAFGRNHIRVYRELEAGGYPVTLAAIVESNSTLAGELRTTAATPVFSSVDECLAAMRAGSIRLDAASVCVPTTAHATVGAALLSAGLDLLIEKPIAASIEEADTLVALARRHSRVLQVGHLERFNPAILAVEAYLTRPMFFEAHRLSIFSPRALDVDVVLDLMIHDIDIVLSFVRSPVRHIHAVGLPILSRKVDIANVRVEFESGCVANFTASRVSTERVRKLRFFQPHQYVSVDYARRDLLVIDVAAGIATETATNPAMPLPPGLTLAKPPVASGEPLQLELKSFLDAVARRDTPRVSGEDGRRALAVALDITAEIAAHAERAGLDRFHI
jgi:predicted dehydrogenase